VPPATRLWPPSSRSPIADYARLQTPQDLRSHEHQPALLDSIHGSVAVIHIHAPPVNSLGIELRQSIVDRLRHALETANVGAIALIGSERAFAESAGLPVIVVDGDQRALDRGMAAIHDDYERSVAKATMARADMDRRLAGLRAVSDDGEIMACDLLIDATAEPIDGRQRAIEDLALHAKQGAILASSDSHADLNRMANATGRPQDMVGLHFFDPARLTRVIEVARCEETGVDVLATCLAFAKRLNKIAVSCGMSAGLIGDRMICHYFAVAKSLIERGVSSRQVDRVLTAFGMVAGPFATMESIDGSSARATEKGAIDRPGLDDAEVIDRCVYALANEGARILEEGIAVRSSDIDVISIHACGFPAHRGGPMHYANEAGLETVAAALKRLAADAAPEESFWSVSPRLARLAAAKRAFS